MADNDYYFDGDPSTDSARRHLERLLKDTKPRRRWPWIAAALTGAAAWYFWPKDKAASASRSASPGPADPAIRATGGPDATAPDRRRDDR